MAFDYVSRVVDAEISHALGIAGAVLIEGARACGKTVTGEHHAASVVRLDVDEDALALAQFSPKLILEGSVPRLIDEWQLAKRVWNHVRRAVDDRRAPGQFILTGSATPADDATRHSGAGRILRLRMRPMSLFESGQASGAVSLSALMAGETPSGSRSELDLKAIVERLCVGGWPGLQHLSPLDARHFLASYLGDVARADLLSADQDAPRHDPVRVGRLLAAYARHVGTTASMATIAKDTVGGQTPLDPDTVSRYLTMLERVMVVEEQPSWGPHLRSREIVRQAATRHFVDPSLAVAALGASPASLLRDLKTLGFLFESMVLRDLRVYAQASSGQVKHYRDSAGLEADAVITLPDGRWAVIEVKLSAQQADQAATSLDALVAKLDLTKIGPPAARIIITAGQYAYTRPDGASVVPLGCLGP